MPRLNSDIPSHELGWELDKMLNDVPWLYDSEFKNVEANRIRRRVAQKIVELTNQLDPIEKKQ